MRRFFFIFNIGFFGFIMAQNASFENKFRPLTEEWATPNRYRTGAGAPGPQYYQQRADYKMKVRLDDSKQRIFGEATVIYYNNSPDDLEYLWLQLDQNTRSKESQNKLVEPEKLPSPPSMSFEEINKKLNPFDGGFNIEYVQQNGENLSYTINWTMMRINLSQPLKSGKSFTFKIKWNYLINDYVQNGGRSGYELFPDSNRLYVIAQWFPRMAVYNDWMGWQNHQFWGRSEFALVFGNYDVNIEVPDDFMVAATGDLQNESEVLTSLQQKRLREAEKNFKQPVLIVTQKEAEENTPKRSKKYKTWHFKAEKVRDFAFSASRKFIWDAMAVQVGKRKVMAYSYYPPEGNPLWEKYSTKVVAHTLREYSKHTFDYPYPKAISIHAKDQGMEYPMICWNYGRPDPDGTYSEETKYRMISVIIHEIWHNFFPMIVNSDERAWTWMDEGLNTFLQFLAEQTFEPNYPSRRGFPDLIVPYMKQNPARLSPIMTKGDQVHNFGSNAYSKTATALNILRETILGRDLFDYAFRTYAQRWMFKHPTPEDFFRTIEDASAVELSWFWRGWFYTTDYNDIALESVEEREAEGDLKKLEEKQINFRKEAFQKRQTNLKNREEGQMYFRDEDTTLRDIHSDHDTLKMTEEMIFSYNNYLSSLKQESKDLMNKKIFLYQMNFEKLGGLVMPIILGITFEDSSYKKIQIPAQIWQLNDKKVSKVFCFTKRIKQIEVDPNFETADINISNNFWSKEGAAPPFGLYQKQVESE